MKASDVPGEVFVIFTEPEWPVDFADTERQALSIRDRRAASGNVSRPDQVHIWRARLELVEEMSVTDPVPARLVPTKEFAS